jgi:hypothetical protein
VKEGSFSIKSGVHHNQKWGEDLEFSRYSWYHELTLLFDVMVTTVDEKSPFFNWFSSDEKAVLGKCDDVLVVMSYALDSARISRRMFLNEAERYGYSEILIPSFSKAMKLHPDHEKQSLQLYSTTALCHKGEENKREKISVRFPSYPEVFFP